MSTDPTPTPETEAALCILPPEPGWPEGRKATCHHDFIVPAPFARRLERERDALALWKQQALSVAPPLQEIGALLGLPLGATINDKILPALQALQAERDEARAAAAMWKANHDNQVALKSAIIQRPDLKDRAPRVEKLILERDKLRAINAELRNMLERITKPLMVCDNDHDVCVRVFQIPTGEVRAARALLGRC